MVHLSLELGHSILSALVVGLVVIGLGWLLYCRVRKGLSPSRWWVLALLRTAAIVLVLLLLYRPVLSIERVLQERSHLIFLVDTSASMATADDQSSTPRFEQARDRSLDWAGKLARDFELHFIAFSDMAESLERPADLSSRKPEGEATSLTKALAAASKTVTNGRVEAALLFSDGVHNAAGDPVAQAKQLGLTVHSIGVGNSLRDSASYQDARITALECPGQLPVNNTARITAQVGQVGLTGRVVSIELEQDGQVLSQQDVELQEGESPQQVTFEFVPDVKGRHSYTVKIPGLPDEKILQNNSRSAITQVVDARIRLLYIEGALRAEYGALVQRLFSKDPDIEFCALVQTRPNVFLQRTNMEGLQLSAIPDTKEQFDKFDVILIGDLDSSYWKPESMALLAERVRGGAGLVMIGGYQSLGPGGYGTTPLAELLPVNMGDREIGQITEAFLPVLTAEGQNHPIFANIAGFFPTLNQPAREEGLPPLDGCVRVAGARPAASVLAVHPGSDPPMPVLAVQPVGKGRAVVFTGDTTRNWQQVLRALNQESPFLRFWGQTIRWLAHRDEPMPAGAGITARTDKLQYEPDEPVSVIASVRDAQGEGTEKAQVTARLREAEKDGASASLAAVSGSPGNYNGLLVPEHPGSYELVVEAHLGEEVLKAEPVAIEVGRPSLEFDRLDLDEAMLSSIASAANGQYYHISAADQIVQQLNRSIQKRKVTREQPLYWSTPFWFLFVGLLTTEWLLRKRYRLR